MITLEQWQDKPVREVITEIVNTNPQIKQLAFVRFFPLDRDDLDLFWKYPSETDFMADNIGGVVDYFSAMGSFPRSEIGLTSLVEIEKEKDPGVYLDLSHEYRHIPMLDFSLPNRDPIPAVRYFLRETNQHGWLLQSGEGSYHFYGDKLITTAEWRTFMRSAQEFSGLINPQFISQALVPKIFKLDHRAERYSTLRIAPSVKHPRIPYVIDVL